MTSTNPKGSPASRTDAQVGAVSLYTMHATPVTMTQEPGPFPPGTLETASVETATTTALQSATRPTPSADPPAPLLLAPMPVIVGSRQDPHVAAVCAAAASEVVVVDSGSFLSDRFTLDERGLVVDGVAVDGRGWLRRLATPDWTRRLQGEGLEAAVHQACVSTLAALLRDERIGWLTSLDAMAAAESKPWQYRHAVTAGCPVPAWRITNDPDQVEAHEWVAKPMGPGTFVADQDRSYVVPTTVLTPASLPAVAGAPFLFQRRVRAATHARVVTVDTKSFSATLDARDLPDDWRMAGHAHHSFADQPAPPHVHEYALRTAAVCGVRYSSQDWICDTDGGWWFVDLNPAGQWLFLPDTVIDAVTNAIAAWLSAPDNAASRPHPPSEPHHD